MRRPRLSAQRICSIASAPETWTMRIRRIDHFRQGDRAMRGLSLGDLRARRGVEFRRDMAARVRACSVSQPMQSAFSAWIITSALFASRQREHVKDLDGRSA